MAKCETGKNRMKWLLPPEPRSNTRPARSNGLADDVGFISMPDGHRIAVAIFARGGSNRPQAHRRGGAGDLRRVQVNVFTWPFRPALTTSQ